MSLLNNFLVLFLIFTVSASEAENIRTNKIDQGLSRAHFNSNGLRRFLIERERSCRKNLLNCTSVSQNLIYDNQICSINTNGLEKINNECQDYLLKRTSASQTCASILQKTKDCLHTGQRAFPNVRVIEDELLKTFWGSGVSIAAPVNVKVNVEEMQSLCAVYGMTVVPVPPATDTTGFLAAIKTLIDDNAPRLSSVYGISTTDGSCVKTDGVAVDPCAIRSLEPITIFCKLSPFCSNMLSKLLAILNTIY